MRIHCNCANIALYNINQVQPTLINMVREPVERHISSFYYLRSQKRWKGKKDVPPAFDDCVLTNDPGGTSSLIGRDNVNLVSDWLR